jgi:phospholipid/cholesterol/gamma-HCH transport system ATP-binding protein
MIEFEQVTKSFGPKQVLKGFTLHVRKGETMVLVGTSGAGKSVTLKHMVGLLTPTSGTIRIAGEVANGLSGEALRRMRARFGYLFQSGALLQWMTVGENVGLPLREHTRMSAAEIDTRVREVLRQVNLEEAIHRYPSGISGGMMKRAGLARAIITNPEIVLYDEPTSGLDPVTSRTIDELINRLKVEQGMTSVVVTHDMISALDCGDRIAMLHQGEVVEVSEPPQFLRSQHPIVRSFLDSQRIHPDFFQERRPSA